MTDFKKRGRPITPKYIQTLEVCKRCGWSSISAELQQVGWRTLRKLKASRHNDRQGFTIEVTIDCEGKGHDWIEHF